MAEVMLGKELHPDRVIQIEKLYEILNEHGISYSFPAQHGIESNAFAVVRCKECEFYKETKDWDGNKYFACHKRAAVLIMEMKPDDFCSYGERRTDNA